QRLARERQVDVVHIADHANAVYAPLFAGLPVLATCHDLLQVRAARGEFEQHRVSALGQRYQAWILDHISRLPHVVVTSDETAADVRRLAGLSPERISKIPLALNYPYRRTAPSAARLVIERMLRERNLPPTLLDHDGRGYIMNIGGGQWYKNRHGVLDMYAELRRSLTPAPRLLMVGKPLSSDVAEHLGRLDLGEDVIHVSNVSEPQLQALYSVAEGLLFPSWHEGFGWPVAEAQACGCPVFTSNRAPMTEVGGDAAVFVDPADAQSAARRIAEAWPHRDGMRRRGLARASEWSQPVMIERYLGVYARAIGANLQPAAA
ncbi:MAG TPA: glycosyltransferase family 1 protein, partial [Opitutus sp.]|nr:glycosyltransferase family 1 protein [Opitutus sp.]